MWTAVMTLMMWKMMTKGLNSNFYLVITLILLLMAVATGNENNRLTRVSFCPQYLPQAQFAGFYVAKAKGFYETKGLDVTIVDYTTGEIVTQGLKENCLTFGSYFLSRAMKLRSEGMELVNIGQISHQSALMLLTRKSANITTPADMSGRKLGMYLDDFNITVKGFIKKYDLDVEVVPVFSGIQLFLAGSSDITTVMWYNEYHTIINSGYDADDLQPFFLKDYGFDIPEDGIYCMASTWEKNPELCQNFVDATMQGWVYAFENPEEALTIVIEAMKNAHVPANLAHQRWMLNTMEKIIFPSDEERINTRLSEEDFNRTQKILRDNNAIQNPIKYYHFYKGAK